MRTPEQRLEGLSASEAWLGPATAPHWRRQLDEGLGHLFHALPAPAGRPHDRYVPRWASAPSRSAGLSPRQWDVLALIITGRSNRVIASRLGISPNTVHKHVTTILDKLGARSRSQAIAVALGLEELEGDRGGG